MVQRKVCQAIESYNLQPETREHLKILGPEMMMMKRTKLRRKLKESSVSQSGKLHTPPPKQDLVVRVTGESPNYMKGTTSSEARKENKKRFNLSMNHKNQTSDKERSNNKPSKRIVRGLTKAPSFKRCSQRATCSSTLKDSKFPEYLMLNHGETHDEVNGTSVLRVCPYTYCSLNGHLQYPPLKSFISSRRRSLKSQKSVKMEASKEEFVEMFVEEKKEYENGNGGTCEVDIDTQISETFSEGAPRSETDSDGYSESAEMVRFPEGDLEIELEENLVGESVKEIQEGCEVDAVGEATSSEIDSDDYSDSAEMVKFPEGDLEIQVEKTLVDESVKENQESCEVHAVTGEAPCSETDSDDYTYSAEMVRFPEGDLAVELKESNLEETLLDDSVKEKIQEKGIRDGDGDQSVCFDSEVIAMMKNSETDDAGEETLNDKAEGSKEESLEKTEVMSKIPFNRTRKHCNQEETDATISWTIIKRKKQVAETEDLKKFNPKEPNYLPVVVDADKEKVDLKHQDMDDRKNSEDWMIDYALQRAVTKLSSERKRKVALLVEAFETVKPITPLGRHLQACN